MKYNIEKLTSLKNFEAYQPKIDNENTLQNKLNLIKLNINNNLTLNSIAYYEKFYNTYNSIIVDEIKNLPKIDQEKLENLYNLFMDLNKNYENKYSILFAVLIIFLI